MGILGKIWKQLGLPKDLQLRVMRVVQDEFLVGTTGIILNDKNEILLVRHTYRGDWSLPGGYLHAKEHPKEGLAREIEEETGLTVVIERELKTRTDRDTARLDITYVGHFIGGTFTPSNEVKEAQFFSFDTLPIIRKDQLVFIRRVLDEAKSTS